MKKHTFAEHREDVWNVFMEARGSMGAEERQLAWFTAYERWLNNRPLMVEEDPSVYPVWDSVEQVHKELPNVDDSWSVAMATPNCPHCGSPSVEIKYASRYHEHTCENFHVWRIY